MESIVGFLKEYQINLMATLGMMCGMLAFFVLMTKTLIPSRKYLLLSLELCGMFLMISDLMAYHYRGDTSDIGFWMVRISNFMVFALTLGIVFIFTLYIVHLFRYECGVKKIPERLKISCAMFYMAMLLLIISQFTGLYYTFDEMNQYHREIGFTVCYLFPVLILILDLSVIIEYFKKIRKRHRMAILLFSIVPLFVSIIQIFVYGISLTNITLVALAVLLYVFAIIDMNDTIDRANKKEIEIVLKEQKNTQLLFKQTATALANAIDAKDKYTHGHSRRVAEYSVKIARYCKKTDKECEEIYFAALLHDVGKIGIKDSIINKEGKLTDEEYGAIKMHPVIGMQILSSINRSPYLSIGAHHHHERYDGHGYPSGLKGDDIPEIARIIAVADAYDAMTSRRSYREPLPQQIVREEFVKGIGTQFDPNYAMIMIHLIDLDSEYMMKERNEVNELESVEKIECGSYRSNVSSGILLTDDITHIHLCSYMNEKRKPGNIPSFVLFDSLDGRIHDDEQKCKELLYHEYAVIRTDGKVAQKGVRKIQTKTVEITGAEAESRAMLNGEKISFDVFAMHFKDHVLLKLSDSFRSHEIIIALPDSSRYAYLSLTGEYCFIENVNISKTGEKIGEGYIPRIAEEISFINVPAGDIPNVQVDGWRSSSSEGIEISDGMCVTFHAKSLPTSRLIWHCPFVVLYAAADGQVGGKDYRELTVVRLDGEGWEEDDFSENRVVVTKLDGFTDWNDWKIKNKAGQDGELKFSIEEGKVIIITRYCGLSIRSVTTFTEDVPKVYAALTGDQCAITNIHIKKQDNE